MPYVEFYKLQNDGSQIIIATCTLNVDGTAACDNEKLTKDFVENGIRDRNDAKHETRLYTKDGLRFLENLRYAFSSGYLNASEVKNDNLDVT